MVYGYTDNMTVEEQLAFGLKLQKQDGSFDKGRALTYEERYWVGEAFGNLGFPLLDYASVNVAIPTQSDLKAVEGYVRDDIAYQIDDIYQKQHDPSYNGTMQNMLGENITRPDVPQKTNTEFLALFLHEYNHQIQYMIANTDLFGSAATGEGKTLFDAAGISDDQMKKISTLNYAGVSKNVVFDQLLFEATWDMPNQEQYTYDLSTNPVSFADFATPEPQCQLWEDLLNYYLDKNTNNTSDSFKDANGKPILSNSDISQILLNSGYDSKIIRKLK